MRIGFLLQLAEELRRPPFSGPANHVRQVFLQFKELGHEVQLLARLDGALWLTDDLVRFKPIVVRRTDGGVSRQVERLVRRIQSTLQLPYFGYFESRRFAEGCLQELSDCEVFYERFAWMAYGGRKAARRLGIPWVLEYNGDPLADLDAKQEAPRGLQRLLSRAISRSCLRGAAHVVASGHGWRNNCIEEWGVASERVSVVENGTDLVELLPRRELRSFRETGAEDGKIRIVYLGGFYAWHGVDKLLKAVAALERRGAPLQLTLIGSGPGEDEARRMCASLGLNGRVQFTGRLHVREYARRLADADIGVSPYCGWAEFSGMKILDYKAAGLACIASGMNGQPSILDHGKTGWIVPPCQEELLAEAIERLAADQALRTKLGRAARTEAEELHSWRHTAVRLQAIFSEVYN